MSPPGASSGQRLVGVEAEVTPTVGQQAPDDDEATQIAPAQPTAATPASVRREPGEQPGRDGNPDFDPDPDSTLLKPPTLNPRTVDDGRDMSDISGISLPPTLGAGTPTRAPLTGTLPGAIQSSAPAARQVGRYLIQERLGRGGMATVFKARDPGIGRDVAIKFLHATLCQDAEYRGRFLREARAAGSLSHPNIVIVHDVGEIEGRPYLAMELLTGQSLAEVMEAGEPLSPREVAGVGIQLARALDYAHSHGIVHRDIKPGNIAWLKDADVVKVMDFGIAHMEASDAGEQATRVGAVLGTPQYMSPEQTQGGALDGRSDLFSVGIVLYQMLTGQRPFQGGSDVALAMKILKEDPPPIEKLRPSVPPSLRRVVERCLAKAPDRRFQSGRELADALTRVVADIDEAARNKEKPRTVPLRVKWAATMGLIVAVVMALSGTLITQRLYDAMMKQMTETGVLLARVVAVQNAGATLDEAWPVVDVSVQEFMRTGELHSITVIDAAGIVRAASNAGLVDKPYRPALSEALGAREGGVAMSRYRAQGESVLGFETPILFGKKAVGRVALGLAERPLQRVAQLSVSLMAGLVVVTVLAVAIAMYVVASWLARPLKQVTEAMGEITRGHLGHRIAEQRKDEFGLLFAAFDRMAQTLQDARNAGDVPPPAPAQPLAPLPAPAPQPDDPLAGMVDQTALLPAAGAAPRAAVPDAEVEPGSAKLHPAG